MTKPESIGPVLLTRGPFAGHWGTVNMTPQQGRAALHVRIGNTDRVRSVPADKGPAAFVLLAAFLHQWA